MGVILCVLLNRCSKDTIIFDAQFFREHEHSHIKFLCSSSQVRCTLYTPPRMNFKTTSTYFVSSWSFLSFDLDSIESLQCSFYIPNRYFMQKQIFMWTASESELFLNVILFNRNQTVKKSHRQNVARFFWLLLEVNEIWRLDVRCWN